MEKFDSVEQCSTIRLSEEVLGEQLGLYGFSKAEARQLLLAVSQLQSPVDLWDIRVWKFICRDMELGGSKAATARKTFWQTLSCDITTFLPQDCWINRKAVVKIEKLLEADRQDVTECNMCEVPGRDLKSTIKAPYNEDSRHEEKLDRSKMTGDFEENHGNAINQDADVEWDTDPEGEEIDRLETMALRKKWSQEKVKDMNAKIEKSMNEERRAQDISVRLAEREIVEKELDSLTCMRQVWENVRGVKGDRKGASIYRNFKTVLVPLTAGLMHNLRSFSEDSKERKMLTKGKELGDQDTIFKLVASIEVDKRQEYSGAGRVAKAILSLTDLTGLALSTLNTVQSCEGCNQK